MSDPEPQPQPRRRRLGGWGGCLMWVGIWLFVVIAGFAIGLLLRPDPDAPAEVAHGQGWKIQVRNDEGERCVSLIIGGEQRTAQCGFLVDGRFKATSYEVGGNQTVIFGMVPDDAEKVQLRLADDSHRTVATGEKKGVPYFVYLSDVPDKGPSVPLDAQGKEIETGS